ncbi:MAG: hypothetical protein R6U98_15765 [Pirellulaceae bacterium]
MESCPTQAVLPLVELAADKIIRDRCIPFRGGPWYPRGATWFMASYCRSFFIQSGTAASLAVS